MAEICLHPDKLFALLDEVSRYRALSNEESEMLETVAVAPADRFKWSMRLEDELIGSTAQPGGIAQFARRHGIRNYHICYIKLHRLRKRDNRIDGKCALAGQ